MKTPCRLHNSFVRSQTAIEHTFYNRNDAIEQCPKSELFESIGIFINSTHHIECKILNFMSIAELSKQIFQKKSAIKINLKLSIYEIPILLPNFDAYFLYNLNSDQIFYFFSHSLSILQ